MDLPINIQDILSGKVVEWERLEFKAGWNPEVVLHTLCAFANDFHNLGGGYIIIGIGEKDGRPVLPPAGINAGDVDRIQKQIAQLGFNAIQPYYHPITVPAEIDGRIVLVLWALGGQTRPYKCKTSLSKKCRDYAYYIRKESATVKASGSDEKELLSLAATVPFDDRFNQQAAVENLSKELIGDYLRRVDSDLAEQVDRLSIEELGRRMGIVGGPAERPFPLNIGLMMFNYEPWRFFPVMQIDVVWFPKEGPGGDTFTEKIFKGPLARMAREALDYIRRNYISETIIKHPDRAEATRVENVPFPAIEEAVVNAVYHRGYDIREPIEVRIMYDEMVVISYPGPDRSVKLDDLRRGKALPRRYRNRRIGEFLKELELTEGGGTGVPKIIRTMKENGSPEPVFEFDDDYSYFMVRLPVHAEVLQEESVDSEVAAQVEAQVEAQVIGRILLACSETSLSSREIATALGHKQLSGNIRKALPWLLEEGMISYTIPDKPRSSNQKYRLTEKGKAFLTQLRGPASDNASMDAK